MREKRKPKKEKFDKPREAMDPRQPQGGGYVPPANPSYNPQQQYPHKGQQYK